MDEARGFLERIYADPADDLLRQVYADWLLVRGDVRGELINFQLMPSPRSGARARREAALLRAHAAEWLGPLEPFLVKSGREFARGFPYRGALRSMDEATVRRAIGLPEWATVGALDVDGAASRARGSRAWVELVTHAVMRSLREITGCLPPLFELDVALPFETVGVALGRIEDREAQRALASLATSTSLAALRNLHFESPPDPANVRGFWGSSVARRLSSFSLRCWTWSDVPYEVTMARWVGEIFEHASWLERVGVAYSREASGWRVDFERGQVTATLEVRGPRRFRGAPIAQLGVVLAAAPPSAVRQLRVVARVPVGEVTDLDRFRRGLARFVGLENVTIDAPSA